MTSVYRQDGLSNQARSFEHEQMLTVQDMVKLQRRSHLYIALPFSITRFLQEDGMRHDALSHDNETIHQDCESPCSTLYKLIG